MEHVADYHGNSVLQIDDVKVLDPVKNHEIEIPKTAEQFWNFRIKQGWELENDFTLTSQRRQKYDLAVFLQAWLFFGLCFAVIQKDGEPILTFYQLVEDNSISTKKLNEALKKWYLWELEQHEANKDQNGLRLRMIQVAYILDHARQVIRSHCACTGDNNTVNYKDGRGPLSIGDEHVLVLMCLAEALCEMKAKITRDCNEDMAGWHPADDQEGWGPPRYVLKRMKDEKWCPRAVRLLRGQFSAKDQTRQPRDTQRKSAHLMSVSKIRRMRSISTVADMSATTLNALHLAQPHTWFSRPSRRRIM